MRTIPGTLGSLLLVALATLACSDATAPGDRTLQVIVADTVHPGDMQITLRNSTGSAVTVDWCNVTLEQQLSTGAWPDPIPRQNVCLVPPVAPGYEETATRTAPPPGGYRFMYPYYLSSSANYLRAYSNAFVVVP